tara:strand:+ start:7429 stop:7755 length:327 start_codon:yes stop_codon:yes gene_type:complete
LKLIKNGMESMIGGWFVGNFEPSAHKTELFEVCYKVHPKGESWDTHYHKIQKEINYLIRGKMTIGDIEIFQGDIFIFEPLEVADPVFLEDCELIVIKTPSIKNDKYKV